jgi:hypothetical protein
MLLLLGVVSGLGCSVPVFRYALEHWAPSSYELIVLHRGPLAPPEKAMIRHLPGISNGIPVNLIVRTLDLASAPEPVQIEYSKRQDLPPLPAMLLRHPDAPVPQQTVWAGRLTEENVRKLTDSPMRRRLVQRLAQGDCAAWVLLESGDRAQDEAAAKLLKTRLGELEKTLVLPKLDPSDPSEGRSVPEERVAFSILRLARNDAGEEILIRMLLDSEEDLRELQSPLVFPVFGRGRILYALAGPGINAETIAEACAFLIGPCSCVVKAENPGFDLLMSCAWDNFVRTGSSIEVLPDITGLTSSLAPVSKESSALSISNDSTQEPCERDSGPVGKSRSLMWRRLSFVFGVFGGMVLLASIGLRLRPHTREDH